MHALKYPNRIVTAALWRVMPGMTRLRWGGILCLFAMTGLSLDVLATGQIALSASEHQLIPLDYYTCQQKIYVQVRWDALTPGPHQLDAFWKLPNGAVQDHTKYNFSTPAQSAVVWLEAEKPFQLMGILDWPGRWTVEIFLDTHSLGLLPFEMRC